MRTHIVYKHTFAVIGKTGQGPSDKAGEWIPPLWKAANSSFSEIAALILHDKNGGPAGVWGAMNDIDEQNKRWGEAGKYMAGCETEIGAKAPAGWSKWIIPAQTYLVAECTPETYGKVFAKITGNKKITITGTIHERYPEPGNPDRIELYFPIS